MSGRRVLDALDVGLQRPSELSYLVRLGPLRLCWCCMRLPGRIPGQDVTCEACFAYLTGETDDDPRSRYP